MAELKEFTLMQLKELLESGDGGMASSYISENLGIARNAQARIVKAQFSGEPVLMPEMRILILKRGWANPVINLTQQHFRAGTLAFLGEQGIVQLGDVGDDVEAIGLSMSSELFSLAIGNDIPKAFDGHLRDFNFVLEPDELDFLDSIHRLIYESVHERRVSSRVTLRLISAFLWAVDHMWSLRERESQRSQSREQRLFSEFVRLVGEYAPREHNIGFYAERLFLSPRYMSMLVKKVSGRAAKEWIDDAIVTKTKIELRHTEKQINLIAHEMGFPNTAFFCKYFKRLTGQTPLAYRSRKE